MPWFGLSMHKSGIEQLHIYWNPWQIGPALIWYYTQWGRIKYTCEEPAQRQRKCKAQVLKCLLIFGKDLLQHTHSGESQCALHISWDKLRSTPGSWKSCFALLFLQVSNIGSRSSSSTPWAGERLSLFTVSGEVLAVLAKIWYFMPRPQPANSSFTANNIFCKYFAAL